MCWIRINFSHCMLCLASFTELSKHKCSVFSAFVYTPSAPTNKIGSLIRLSYLSEKN